MAAGDFNGDERPDMLAGEPDGSTCLWLNQGGGRFWVANSR